MLVDDADELEARQAFRSVNAALPLMPPSFRLGMGCSTRAATDQRTLPNQAFDCVDHKHGPNRKLDQIAVDNPVSITGGSGSYPDR